MTERLSCVVYGKASTGLISSRTSKYSTIIITRVHPLHPQFIPNTHWCRFTILKEPKSDQMCM